MHKQDTVNNNELPNIETILKASIESFKDVLLFSIDTNYRYLVFNNAFKQATEVAYGTVITPGLSMLDSITNPKDRQHARNNCDKALAGEAHVTVEVFGDINRNYFETTYSPIRNDAGVIIGVTVLSLNVTERKKAEEQLRLAHKELESFSYSISHDLRAPLRAIDGYAAILKDEFAGNLDDEAKAMIGKICGNAKRMGSLIDDLLAFSRLGRKELIKMPIDMTALAKNAIGEVLPYGLNSNTLITVNELLPVLCDRNLIKQVWVNLISNAIKYSAKNSSATVEVGCTDAANDVVYYIKDNGVGFSMAYYDKLFGVFQRLHADAEFEGTGVGLAIVQRIINRHGGRVWAEAELGKGATFYFSLPKA